MDLGKELYLDTEDNDLDLILETDEGEIHTIPGHSIILKRSSSVFRAMLSGDKFVEGQTRSVKISIPGCLIVGLCFVRYLYNEVLDDLDGGMNIALVKLSHYYGISSLGTLCEERLLEQMKPNTVCRIVESLLAVGSPEFLNRSTQLIFRCAFFIFNNNLHLELSEQFFSKLVRSDELNATEDDVLQAIWEWGQLRCITNKKAWKQVDIKQEILSLLPYVRWPLVTDQISNLPCGFLSKEYQSLLPTCNLRKPNENPSLIKYSEVFDILDLMSTYEKSFSERKANIAVFSLQEDVYLTGIYFELVLSIDNFQLNQVEISINGINIKDNASCSSKLKYTVSRYRADSNSFLSPYIYDIFLELKANMLLKKTQLQVISMELQVYPISHESFKSPCLNTTNSTEPSNNILKTQDNGNSVFKIYYFKAP